jgi:hypothetical protein
MLRDKIADLITNELFERFGSPSSAVIGVQLADRILAIEELNLAVRYLAQARRNGQTIMVDCTVEQNSDAGGLHLR